MANLANYSGGNAAMLMLDAQQRTVGAKPAAHGGPSGGDPPFSPLNGGGGGSSSSSRFHQHQQAAPPNAYDQPQDHHHQHHFDHENYQQSPARKSLSSSFKPAHENSAASAATSHTQATSSATAMAVNAGAAASDGLEDIRKCGYLRKQKHGHKRFFVLRAASRLGPSRLEYYDSEKKFRSSLRSAAAAAAAASTTGAAAASSTSPPKRVIYLYQCFTVNKRADSKNKYLIALYTKDEYFAIVAENEQEQEDWYLALSDLMCEGKKGHSDADELDDGYGTVTVTPGTVFKEVWQVNVKPKGLGQTKNLTGVYRLCLSTKTIHLVKLNSETPCVNLQLMNIRRCGHSESFFFIEVGRSSSIGPGELWMQVDDSVVAQNMHETILDTMKALKAYAEFRPRSKSQSSGSNPMAFMTTRRHLGNLPPSQTGLQRRSRAESVVGTPPSSKSSGASGYRFRTSSEGEGTMNRPFRSVTGSLIHLNAARANLSRHESSGGAGTRYVRAPPGSTYHARSASLPVSHFPSTTSPISMSSSSGHGSVTDTNTRPSSASICGSPSDGGFNSSDEYGSSPGDFRYFRVRSNTPDSLSNTPPIREEHCLSYYMAMGWNRDMFSGSAGEASRDETADEDSRPFRRRTPSFSRQVGAGSTGSVAVYQKMTQTNFSLDEAAAEDGFLGSNGQLASISSSLRSDYSSSSEHSQDNLPALRAADSFKDDGYMPMMARVVPSSRDTDYMPMQPSPLVCPSPQIQNVSSPPSQQIDSQGYMMMLPGGNGGSEPPVPASPHIGSRSHRQRGTEHSENGEYMDMSHSRPMTGRRKFSNDNYYTLTAPEVPKSYSSYFSLPRSYKTPAKHRHENDDYVHMSSPSKPVYISPSTTPEHNGCSDMKRHSARPDCLPPSRRSFHGSLLASEIVERSSSPGDYINIEYDDQAILPITTEDTLTGQNTHRQDRHSPFLQDYMSVDVDGLPPKSQSSRSSLVAPWNPPTYIRTSGGRVALGQQDDYTEMSCGRHEERRSPTTRLQHLSFHDERYPSPSTPAEPKVIRADPQGRRRHCSETFTSTEVTGANGLDNSAPVSSTVPQVTDKKRLSSSSFDSTWMCVENKVAGDTEEALGLPSDPVEASASSVRTRRTLPVEDQNGLNYIALDLRDDQGTESASVETPLLPSGVLLPENGEYASIDFTKSERMTAASAGLCDGGSMTLESSDVVSDIAIYVTSSLHYSVSNVIDSGTVLKNYTESYRTNLLHGGCVITTRRNLSLY
ncbi:Insulin receptor substrate 2-B [Bagarius yarrelli]|uniref:Insulin receptor substrate 2-B n=1 Tax=Bagarius yarrelli TaxID=175774 RepID=A0A556TZ91_BAGYA|nr:Insulin receptor substrate 2-B [Bagarius yarrelli]